MAPPREPPKPRAQPTPAGGLQSRRPAGGRAGASPSAPAPEDSTVLFDGQGNRKPRVESTMLIDTLSLPDLGERARLVGTRGKRRGMEFALRGSEVTIGRDPSNDIAIADISVSRHHARLRRTPEGWLLSDAGGGNGTRVNGLTVEEIHLNEGDLIELGTTELRFVEAKRKGPPPGAVEGEAAADGKRRSGANPQIRNLAVGIVALFAVLIVIKVLVQPARGVGTAHGAAEEDQFAVARKLVFKQRWDDAKVALMKAQRDDPDNPEIKRYLETVIAEAQNQRHLDAANAALAKADPALAMREVKEVGAGSLLSDAATQCHDRIDAALAALVEKANGALTAGDLAGAKLYLDQALRADPAQLQGLALQQKLATATVLARASASERARIQAETNAKLRLERGPVGQARNLFHGGDAAAALSVLRGATGPDAAPAAKLAPQISGFTTAFQRGKQALATHRTQAAVDALGTAHALAVQVGGDDGSLAVSSGHLLAQVHDQLGMTARSARSFDKAYRHFAAALAASPSDASAKEQIHRLETEAHELFLTGYSQMDSDPAAAARNFKFVIQMTPTGSSDHKRAQERLTQLHAAGP